MMLPKIHIWMNFPSHHQSGLFAALLEKGIDLKVTYYQPMETKRIAQGWEHDTLKDWELSLTNTTISPMDRLLSLSDHVHIIPGYGTPLLRSLALTASKAGIKWCHWSETSHPGWRWAGGFPRKFRYASLVNRYALGAFAQGDMARRDFIRWGIKANKLADLYYSVASNIAPVQPDSRIVDFAHGRHVFLFVGQINSRKGVDVLLRAFAKIRSDKWVLVLVGKCDDANYLQKAGYSQLTDRVLVLPPIMASAVASAYRAADVVVLPSRFDGWGVVLNEAAYEAKALIGSTNSGSAWHLIEPGINGFLVNPGSINSLTSAMQRYVLGGKELAAAHGEESLRISQRFTCEASATRMVQTLRSWMAEC